MYRFDHTKKVSTFVCPKCIMKTMMVDASRDKVFCPKCRTEGKFSEFVKRQNGATYEHMAKIGRAR